MSFKAAYAIERPEVRRWPQNTLPEEKRYEELADLETTGQFIPDIGLVLMTLQYKTGNSEENDDEYHTKKMYIIIRTH